MRMGRTWIISGALVLGAAMSWPVRAGGQFLTGLRAEWGDLETWSHYLEDSKENELGLGLQVSGPGGTMLVAFLGKLDVRAPNTPPKEISVQVGANERANPNIIRSATLTFIADEKTEHRKVLDFSSRLLVDNPAPGAASNNGLARVPATDFLRLASAETLRGTVLGFDVEFRRDQLRAMQAFAATLHFKAP